MAETDPRITHRFPAASRNRLKLAATAFLMVNLHASIKKQKTV